MTATHYQTVVSAPGFSIGVRCDEAEIHAIDYLEPRAEVSPENALAFEAARQLKLGNIEVAESRIEAFDAPGRFDAITARALATLPLILELGGHLLKPEGRLLAMKGVVPEDEIAALPAGWRVAAVHPLRVPGLDAERHLLEVVKSPG